jgi:hypothetical protein
MQQVKTHDVAPAYLFLECFYLWKLAALATVILVVIIITAILLAPLLEAQQFGRFRKYYFEKGFFLYGFEVIIDVVMILMSVPDYFCCMHINENDMEDFKCVQH